MRHRTLVTGAAALALVTAITRPAAAATVTVCPSGCPFSQIAPAVAAANAGDTVKVAPGTYDGGFTIDKDLALVGSGTSKTTIAGGGPVITVGTLFAASEPIVAISSVTITGGSNTSNPAFPWLPLGARAAGGGILVPPAANFAPGATLTITDSLVTGNHATPTATAPFGPPCPDGPCPYGEGSGGGIASWGALTLTRTTVRDNDAGGPLASDANGGGIFIGFGQSLALTDSAVTENRASAVAPNGRYAEGGGIFGQDRVTLTIRNSVVSDNSATLSSSFPFFVGGGNTLDMNANGGGIHDSNDGTLNIDDTKISGNTISVDDPNGEPYAFDAGLAPGGRSTLQLSNSTISDNHVIANVESSANVGPSGSALDLDGPATIRNTRITDNTTLVTASSDAYAGGAVFGGYSADNGAIFSGDDATPPALITDSVISGNSVRAVSTGGAARVYGGGVLNNGLLLLRNDLVSDNSGDATGPAGFAEGGGIWNGAVIFAPPVQLLLDNTNITRNTLTGGAGVTVQGGGLFTTFPVTLTNSRIDKNTPDQCVGC
jgi:hypothetical protein